MPRTLKTLAIGALALTGCLRFGYKEHPRAADGGMDRGPDAAASFDSGANMIDAAVYSEGGAPPDASSMRDAAGLDDASAKRDAATAARDAGAAVDAASGADAATIADGATNADAAAPSDASTGCATSTGGDYCSELPLMPAAPLIDGTLDCGPALVDLQVIGWTASTAYPNDNRARYAAAWHPSGLYFYVEVDDPVLLPALSGWNPWCGDGVELYADSDGVFTSAPSYDQPGAMQLLATSPLGDTGTGLATDARYHTRSKKRISIWTGNHIAVKRDNGYAFEALITATDLELPSWTLTAGNKVGFDIAINVSISSASSSETVDCGYNLGQYYLHIGPDCTRDECYPHTAATAFCTATLK